MSLGIELLDLLRNCASQLREARYEVAEESLAGAERPWLVAENAWFAIGVIVGQTVEELRELESLAVESLLARVATVDASPKRWDMYLLMLAADEAAGAADKNLVATFRYNTHGLRRLVAHGVEGDADKVAWALRPFLPLPEGSDAGLDDPFAALESDLVLRGVEPSTASRYVGEFRATGEVE